ncbi:hypothetical protein EHI8A_057680 [Entamoeba histolytica HM-1:IMSS-B]|uniref:DH domain-containing protein n=6 Tax=Entamoeba histolytica TaxID=5759 RepID=C4LXB6_ENTH1|nr:hypothetical protein EHI_098330 [Entamoeba histolytica HM-1:IMSS]EMD46801.1 Hypothetical protein EHI5A_083080 [Entamoeba histolytica KU27]EMH74684.1 hypothetical protein EHI8A_057680 [Entamoeba histolytica HM-1:IMSS-B]EMS13627.1 hypothetical protein KM1_095200 [Entamoeba histolytica HM-3:IMSS]ENY61585.1 hypothetical protein EHI7A_052470 [Entamoeba histolytica HM-1:IMSS-A]GAT93389.1 hypothetical protein CL6EHI_098330 [Entamoeba histolytica]|eukprot:XP_653616.1 hypothetical protein EHI_098330 [Entamoeba histolytica HM-1:IMSS]
MKQLSKTSENPLQTLHRSITSEELKKRRRAERFDCPSCIEMQGYISVLEEIIQKKNTIIAKLMNEKEVYKIFDELRQANDPSVYAEDTIETLISFIENRNIETKNNVMKKWEVMLQSRISNENKKVLKSFVRNKVKTKYQYIDIGDETTTESDVQDDSTILEPLDGMDYNRCDQPKPKINEKLFGCLVDDFTSSQILYYQQFQILTQLFISPLRNLQMAKESIKLLDNLIPPMMMVERKVSRCLQLKDETMWQTIKECISEMKVYIPYISTLKTTTIKADIVECCMSKEFKKEQQPLIANFFNKNGSQQLLPVTVYLEAPVQRFFKYPKIFGNLLASVDPKRHDYAIITSCYLNINKMVKKMGDYQTNQEEQKKVIELSHLFKQTQTQILKDGRKLLYYGPLKIIEEKNEWNMCFLFNDLFVVSKAIVIGALGLEKESLMRFENAPSGTDLSSLMPYNFNEILCVSLSHFLLKKVVDCNTATNAFMIQVNDIQLHCCCVSVKERHNWIGSLLLTQNGSY